MKTHQKMLEEAVRYDMSYFIRIAIETGMLIRHFAKEIDAFAALHPDLPIDVDSSEVKISRGSREQVKDFLLTFGGDWEKNVEEYDSSKIFYSRKILHPLRDPDDDMVEDEENPGQQKLSPYIRQLTIAAHYVSPPPSCRVEDVEVEVPARKEIRKKIVCPKNLTPVEELSEETVE